MKNLRKNLLNTGLLLLLCICFLFNAEKTASFAYVGLNTWFEHMIISLFPFLVLMNLLLKTGLSDLFIRPFYYILRPVFKNTSDAIFVIFFGFLCGFPLGAKCVVDLYKNNKISKENAEYLLCFANNIGPAYMLGFFIGTIQPETSAFFAVVCLYAVPFMYGILLRYTLYKKTLDEEYKKHIVKAQKRTYRNIFAVLPEAVTDSLRQISVLGGYMIFFNALRIVPHIFLQSHPIPYTFVQSILEISGGLLCVDTCVKDGYLRNLCLYAVFSFNGLCCHFQTFALFQDTPFSGKKYMLHKIILCSIICFFVWFFTIR